jgi:lipopolysaccharide export system permease protein
LSDIVFAKPSFDLKEGVFYDKIGGFAIKVGKKEANDSVIKDVIIYEQNAGLQDNFIIAKDGVMRITDDKRFLEFNLQNGWRYQERGTASMGSTEFIRLGFKEYKKQFDLSAFQFQRTADSVNKNNHRMLSMRQLDKAIDSLRKENSLFGKRTYYQIGSSLPFLTYLDSNWQRLDTPVHAKSLNALIPDSILRTMQSTLTGKVESMRSTNDLLLVQYKDQSRTLRVHQIEWHRKISLSLACLVLFLIGAPLGSIIRKGGLGSPLVFSIVFFMVFYFLSSTGEKMGKEGSMDPKLGMWLSTIVLVPVGIFLIIKALNDSQVFNKEFYFRSWKKLQSLRQKK